MIFVHEALGFEGGGPVRGAADLWESGYPPTYAGVGLVVGWKPTLRLAVAKAERPFQIDAFVVLPDHLQCVWTLPGGDGDFGLRWRLIKSRFSLGLQKGPVRPNPGTRAERGIWQRRFWEHPIRGDEDMGAHVGYCWGNPVKRGLVERPEDWPFSSAHRDLPVRG